MMSFPFTFAIFFQSIINPNMTTNKKQAKNVLFAGKLSVDKSESDYISPSTFSDYIKGNRPIRNETVNKICNMSLEELTHRIHLLGFQDISYILKSIEKLLQIVNITSELKQDLLSEMIKTKNTNLYLAKIFQLSMKCPNTKKNLNADEIKNLNQIGKINLFDYPKSFFSQIEKESYSQHEKETIDSSNFYSKIKETFSPTIYDEINEIFSKQQNKDNILFHGIKIIWQDVILPYDFDALIQFITLFKSEDFWMDFSYIDVLNACFLDVKNKICKEGYLKLLDFSYVYNEINNLDSYDLKNVINIEELKRCKASCLMIVGDVKVLDILFVYKFINNYIKNSDILFGILYNDKNKNHINIKALFRMA